MNTQEFLCTLLAGPALDSPDKPLLSNRMQVWARGAVFFSPLDPGACRKFVLSGQAGVAAAESLRITVTAMDVDDNASVAEVIAAIQAEHGPIDVLVNNAGVECFGSIEEVSMSDFRAVVETIYFGALRCVKALIPQMRERRQGTIINVSSVAGSISHPPTSPYSASNWALEAMCEGLAREMKAFGVRVVMIKPGIIDTSMAQRTSKIDSSLYPHAARMSGFFAATLAGEPGRPSLVAQLMVNVANSDSWQLQYVVGPGADDLLAFRKSMSDEDWVALHASDDATFQRLMSGGEQLPLCPACSVS